MTKLYDIHSEDGTWDDNYSIKECEYGAFVTLDDYEALCTEYDNLKEKYDKLVNTLGDLYREG